MSLFRGAMVGIEEIVSGGALREGGTSTSHPCCNFDGRCRLWEGLQPPMDHQQANQPITTHPLPQPFGNQSSNFVGIHQWIASSQIHHPFSEAASLFVASQPCERSPLLPQIFIYIWPEFPLSIKIKSVPTQFLQVQRWNFTRG